MTGVDTDLATLRDLTSGRRDAYEALPRTNPEEESVMAATQKWRKSLGRWWLGPMTDPIAMVTILSRGEVECVVYPHSPNPIKSRFAGTSKQAMDHAEALIREQELT